MFIRDDELRFVFERILKRKNKLQIVNEIKDTGVKFNYANLTNFLGKQQVTIKTLKILDKYAVKWMADDVLANTPQL